MFVESMSFEQMRNQALDDLKPIVAKVLHHGKAISRVMRKTNMSHFKKYYDYTAPVTKNHWVYSIELANAFAKSYGYTCISYFETGKNNYAAIVVAPATNCVFYFTKHFFDRYNQRLGLGKQTRRDVMLRFLEDNQHLAWSETGKIKAGKPQVLMQTKYGAGLGHVHDEINFIEMRTFISNEMLSDSQLDISFHLEEETPVEVIRPLDDEIIPIPKSWQAKQKSTTLPPHIIMQKTMVFKHF